jgi:hypothetical protein
MNSPVYFSYQGLPSWQIRILKQFPSIYLEPDPRSIDDLRNRRYNPHAPFYTNLRFGFEGCGIGWEKLLLELSSTADALCKDLRSSARQPNARITALLVKQKFGSLRWQSTNNLIEPYRTLFFGYIEAIKSRSGLTCEICSEPGRIRNVNGWDTAICDKDFDRLTKSNSRED